MSTRTAYGFGYTFGIDHLRQRRPITTSNQTSRGLSRYSGRRAAAAKTDTAATDAADAVSESDDSAESEVTEEEVAATRARDAAVAADDAREVTQAEESDVRSDPTGASRGINPMLFRQPPVPDDSADGTIEIRFKHPE